GHRCRCRAPAGIACRSSFSHRRIEDGLIMRTRTLAATWSALTLATTVVVGGTVGVPPTAAASCPSPNAPDQMVVSAGTPQTTKTATRFATDLAVVVQSSSGCP